MRPEVGQVINNKYRLLRLIGDGGMGTVYEARHEVLGTSVALKFLHHELSRRSGLVQRFLQEARVSAQVQSPHVVRVTDVDQASGGAYIVMEYLEGKTLQTLYEELYRAGQQLSYGDALEYAMQMLDGVEAAHEQSVVHRDLKPDNVMITTDTKGRKLLKLLDFGIAKLRASSEYDRGLTRPGVIMGTPEYMAPEQAFSADAVDARADIFSLGVMIFEMLAGRRPVGGDEPQQIAAAYLSGRIAQLTDLAPEISPDLGEAVHRAMGARPSDRWHSVKDFRDALEPFAIAAKAPSALPAGSLSSPGISMPPVSPPAMTPPATNVGGGVPRTSDGGVSPDATNPADPPRMSSPVIRDATPIGGFVLADAEGAAASPAVPPTKSVSPYVPEGAPAADRASTAFASPLIDRPSIDHSPRPSGTAIGEPVFPGFPGSADPAEPLPAPAPYDAPPAPPPPAYTPPVVAAPRSKPKSRGFLRSLPAILLLAAGIAGAVVGGVYIAHNATSTTEEPDEPPTTSAPSATVASEPPPETPTTTEPPPTTTIAKPPPPLPQKRPQPRPSSWPPSKPPPGPAPSAQPSARPPVLPLFPPIVIPSTFPLSLPFVPGGGPPREPPRSEPDMPPRRRYQEPPAPQDEPPRRYQPRQPRREPDFGDDQSMPPRAEPMMLRRREAMPARPERFAPLRRSRPRAAPGGRGLYRSYDRPRTRRRRFDRL